MAEEDKKVTSVQARIETPELLGPTNFWSQVISWGRQVDNTPAWGSTTRAVYLDDFWKADRMLPGVVYTMVSRVASLGWSITGPTEDLHYWHSMILDSDGGYSDLIRLLAKDYFCTDEGAVFEVGRDSYPDGPARQLWHMDARLCIPGPIKASVLGANGTPKEVTCDLVFKDVDGLKCMMEGHFHRFCSLPATDQTRRRLGFCFLSRALRAAKLANFLTEYQEEELKDMPPEGIATASGITEAQVKLAIQQHESERQRKEQYTFPGILWIVGNALGQEVKLEWHPFRRLWEKFDERTAWEVYMKTLSLDAGLDIAELWQIETTGATKAQVSIQHRKAMGKGPSEFLIDFERTINREILPVGYIFAFDQRDDEQDLLVENIRSMRIRNVRELWRPDPATAEGLITRDQAMEMLAEEGVIPTRFVAPPEGRLTDITKEVSGLNTATIYHDGTIERHRSYWQLNGKWKEEKATEPFPFEKGGPGSGHHGHLGRPGKHGGSLPRVGAYGAVGDWELSSPASVALEGGMNEGVELGWEYASVLERRRVKDGIVTGLSEQTGIPYNHVNKFVQQWSISSNDDDMRSLAVQKDAATEFGLPVSEFTMSKIAKVGKGPISIRSRRLLPAETQKTLLKTMHARTQEWFKDIGLGLDDTVTLFRGVRLPSEIVAGWGKGDTVSIVGNTLESWSVSSNIAERFSGKNIGAILAARIPVRSIIATSKTGLGCLKEGELVVMGSLPGEVTVVEVWAG